MKQRCGKLAFHSFAQGQLARGFVRERADFEHRIELAECFRIGAFRHAVDGSILIERFDGWQVPDELLLLPHHQRYGAQEIGVPALRYVVGDGHFAARGMQEARKYFQRRGFSGSIGSEKPDPLSLLDGKGQIGNRNDGFGLAPQYGSKCGDEPCRPLVNLVNLRESANANRGAHSGVDRLALARAIGLIPGRELYARFAPIPPIYAYWELVA